MCEKNAALCILHQGIYKKHHYCATCAVQWYHLINNCVPPGQLAHTYEPAEQAWCGFVLFDGLA